VLYHQAKFQSYARSVYKRPNISGKSKRRLKEMVRCAYSPEARKAERRFRRRLVGKREAWLLERKLTPYGKWAIPAPIVMCESHGNFRARNAHSSAGGAYQILDSTWYAHGGSRYNDSHPAAVAPPLEQHKIAGRIWRSGGAGQWSCA
jgi:hypothetical protein